ncbi:MAG: alpha/beta hydrolase, partial [Burkholderiales bacterium]
LAYEEVNITTADSEKLHGWFVPADQSRGVLLFFHGNAGNISHRLDWLELFHAIGMATLIVDYRGYGTSSGKPSEEGTYRDAEAAWKSLVESRGFKPDEIVVFGESLGGAIAAHLAARKQPGALIVLSGFTSVPDIASEVYSFVPARLLARFEYNTLENIKKAACPVLVIHSPDDEIIPFEHGRSLYDSANEPRQFLEIEGGHNDGFIASRETLKNGIRAFLATALSR